MIKLTSILSEDLRKWFGKGPTGGWDRYNSKGEKVGKCGDSEEGSKYAACLSNEKAAKLGKDGRASFVKRKQTAQSKAGDAKKGGEQKKGQKPVFVKTGASENKNMNLEEKLNLFLEKNVPTDPAKWAASIAAAKKKFDVYPSAYANGWASKNYKEKGGKWKVANEGEPNALDEACWDGYKQVGMKKKGDRQVPNCVPVNENEAQSVECAECGWEWDLSDGGKDPYLCHKCGHDNTDDYDELDVEDEDEEDFLNFLKGYTTEINEAEYQGREVKLGKPMQGDVKKFKVYVKNPAGNVVKVNFGHGGTSAAAAGEETMRIRKSNPDARKSFRARHNCDEPGPRTKARYWSCKKW